MVILALSLIMIINLIIQSTILPYIPIFGYVPNTALVIIVVVALLKGKHYGGFFGLILGLIQDILFGTVVGVNGLIYFALGYTIGFIQTTLNVENSIIPAICSGLGTIIYNSLYFLLMFFLSRSIPMEVMIKNTFSIEILYNSILAVLIYKQFSKFFGVPSLRFGKRLR